MILLCTLFIGDLFSFIASLIVNGNIDALLVATDLNLKDQFWMQATGFLGNLTVVVFNEIITLGFAKASLN